jgi:hypothetical protein
LQGKGVNADVRPSAAESAQLISLRPRLLVIGIIVAFTTFLNQAVGWIALLLCLGMYVCKSAEPDLHRLGGILKYSPNGFRVHNDSQT